MPAHNLTRMLVVEDNEHDSFLLTRQIARAHLNDCVTVVGNGTEALNLLMRLPTPPLAIFLDLKLPGLSGIEVLERLKQEPRFRSIPVIVMTGSDNPKDVEECGRLGVTAYLSKPISLATFIKTVAHLFPQAPMQSVQKN